YLVFADAHRALTLFARLGIDPPPRFGCATVAASLLAEGADRRRDHRPLVQSVRELLGRELPEGLLSVMSTNHRLVGEAVAPLVLLRAVTLTLRERRLAWVSSFGCELLPAVVAMESAGIGIDATGLERVASSWVRERGVIEALTETERDGDRV